MLKEYLVEWEKYDKETTRYSTGKYQETVEAESEEQAIQLVRQHIYDNADHEEYPDIEMPIDGDEIDFGEFQYCNFQAK